MALNTIAKETTVKNSNNNGNGNGNNGNGNGNNGNGNDNVQYTLYYRREHPGGGKLGRCSYGVPGVSGIVVFDNSLFATLPAPDTITLSVPLAPPRHVARRNVTSAVIADANAQVAQATGQPIAEPAQVAATADKAATRIVSAAKAKTKA